MGVKLQATSGGSVELVPTNTASNYTLTVPAATGTAVIQNASNNLLMNSGYGSDAVAYGCRAWVNFNGTGTVAIRGSGNVSSITDRGTGQYTINFINAMPDANYSVSGTAWFDGTAACVTGVTGTPLTTAVPVNVDNNAGSGIDAPQCHYSIFR
jgi:hypothetical protein